MEKAITFQIDSSNLEKLIEHKLIRYEKLKSERNDVSIEIDNIEDEISVIKAKLKKQLFKRKNDIEYKSELQAKKEKLQSQYIRLDSEKEKLRQDPRVLTYFNVKKYNNEFRVWGRWIIDGHDIAWIFEVCYKSIFSIYKIHQLPEIEEVLKQIARGFSENYPTQWESFRAELDEKQKKEAQMARQNAYSSSASSYSSTYEYKEIGQSYLEGTYIGDKFALNTYRTDTRTGEFVYFNGNDYVDSTGSRVPFDCIDE